MLNAIFNWFKTGEGGYLLITGLIGIAYFVGNGFGSADCRALREANDMDLPTITKNAKEATVEMKQAVGEFEAAKDKFHESIVATDTYQQLLDENKLLKEADAALKQQLVDVTQLNEQLTAKVNELTPLPVVTIPYGSSEQVYPNVVVGLMRNADDTAYVAAGGRRERISVGEQFEFYKDGKTCTVILRKLEKEQGAASGFCK